jgi:hypothetical protein
MAGRTASERAECVSIRPHGPAYRGGSVGYDRAAMADQTPAIPLDQQLQEIGAQLAWVRDYL